MEHQRESPPYVEDIDEGIMSSSEDTPLHSPKQRPIPPPKPNRSPAVLNNSNPNTNRPEVTEPLQRQERSPPSPSTAEGDNLNFIDEDQRKKDKCCPEHCVNKYLLPLKLLVFIFYGGIGVLCTWLNHSVLSKRFTERESALIYGLSALFSFPIPIIFGLISDTSAQPKRVLTVCLFLASLLSPLTMLVPETEPYQYREHFDWCRSQIGRNETTCLPNFIKCGETFSELISNTGKCGENCAGKLYLTKCTYNCDPFSNPVSGAVTGDKSTTVIPKDEFIYDYDEAGNKVKLEPSAQVYQSNVHFNIEPHVCVLQGKNNRRRDGKKDNSPLCHVFDSDMHDVVLEIKDVSGTIDEQDEKCHYPLLGYSESTEEFEQLLSCSPLSSRNPNCHVSCSLGWNYDGSDQWVCGDTYRQWLISFFVFLGVHTVGTMLIISAAGLLNSAIMCSVHEHEHGEYLGCQFIYAALGFATFSPVVAFIFELFNWQPTQWNVAHIVAFSSWLLVCAILSLFMPYNAEWVPKSKEIRPMLQRWTLKSSTILFFHVLVILGCLQGIIDVLGYYQIRSIVRSKLLPLKDLTSIGLTATAAIIPGFVFIFRVERVIEFCGYQNLLAISLVVFSLQFTGYAYLKDVVVEWSYLIKALDIFSIIMVVITSSFTIHASAPRRLVATCQTILVILYCCIGRGIGGLLTNVGLLLFPKEYLFKIISLCCIAVCLLFLIFHYTCLKPVPYTKKYNIDKLPESQAPTSGKYIPLKLVSHKDKSEDQDRDGEM